MRQTVWFGAVLAGLAAARLVPPRLSGTPLARWRPGRLGRALALAGRHSLAIYLVHQPLLLALLTGLVTLTGPHPRAGLDRFHADYEANCVRTGGEAGACARAARCTADALRRENLWSVDGRRFTAAKTLRAQDLWDQVAYAAWACADPGVQFDTTINEWHTCPTDGRINASNPCSEYLFLDDTACNLCSLNLMAFHDSSTGNFKLEDYLYASRLWTVVLEISVAMAQFPSQSIARRSFDC